jgi:glycosyltransferase involved in cell wall biosynthesis
LKAVFVASNLNVGGLERQWSILVPALARRGVVAEVVTLDGEGRFFDEIVAQGVPAQCVGLHGPLNVVGAVQAARNIAMRAPDLIVSAGVSAHVVAQLAGNRAKAPHIAAMHAVSDWPMSLRRRLILRLVAPHFAASTAVTSAQLGFLRSLGLDTTGTRVIPSGVERPVALRSRSTVRSELGVPDDAFVSILVATLRPEKRVDIYVDAVVRAHRECSNLRGFVVGGGPELDRTRELCAEIGAVVTALGPRNDITDLIESADVVCLTSDTEALPLAALEALAGGRPVIATDVGGMRDVVVDGETGYLVPSGDAGAFAAALVRLARDPERSAELGEAGRRRHGARFTTERMVDAYLELFRELRRVDSCARPMNESPTGT